MKFDVNEWLLSCSHARKAACQDPSLGFSERLEGLTPYCSPVGLHLKPALEVPQDDQLWRSIRCLGNSN